MLARRHLFAGAPALLAGTFWAFVGVAKLVGLFTTNSTEGDWISQFPFSLVVVVALAEVCLGAWLALRPGRTPLVLAMLLLSTFSLLVITRPPAPGSACGCMGFDDSLRGTTEIVARNFAILSFHVLALALLPRSQPHRLARELEKLPA